MVKPAILGRRVAGLQRCGARLVGGWFFCPFLIVDIRKVGVDVHDKLAYSNFAAANFPDVPMDQLAAPGKICRRMMSR
jgi:hypothetical protein